ncbi:MAG TPA: ABC transporter permease [Microlunatus sp.]|nr:ABC transporter permease [Microlunatus sp.]
MGLARYLGRKLVWTIVVFFVALLLNFLLPRVIPGNPVDAIVGQLARGGSASGQQLEQIHAHYMAEFGLDKPLWQQFFIYLNNILHGNLGTSFGSYPASVNSLIGQALPWSLALMVPAVLIGWVVGNILGAVAAYRGGWVDRGAFVGSLFFSSVPPFALGIILLFLVAVRMGILPIGGAYSFGLSPELSASFFGDAITYWWLPFWSVVLVFIGGQAVGMRSMAIYELGSDYVNYNRGLGVRESYTVSYIFRNAMLPQVTGLALAIAGIIAGSLITELVFSYPGLGSLLFTAIGQSDYPVIQGITLLITIAVVLANFAVDVITGFIDPRIKASQTGER